MKNSYLDLTLLEFLDAITHKKIQYTVEIEPSIMNEKDENDKIIGDKNTLIDFFKEMILNNSTHPSIKEFERTVEDLRNKDEYTFDELNDIEIYNYLGHITKDFDIERVKIILWDIDVYYNMHFLDRIKEESMNEYLKNGWEIPEKEIVFKPKAGKKKGQERKHIIPDYKTMLNKTHIADGWSIQRAISMLKKKLPTKAPINNNPLSGKLTKQQTTDLHTELCKNSLINPDIDSFLYWFGVTDKKPNNLKILEWKKEKSKALLAYFIDNVADKYKIKHGAHRLVRPFETMFNVTGISGAINDYKKTGDLPIGYEIIDNILK
jgi:hypothetical protein